MTDVKSYGLGRLHIPDKRDQAFRMAAPPSKRTFRNWLVPGGVSDQGSTSHCVAYSCEAWLRALPTVNAHKVSTAVDKVRLYREAQEVDQWPGTDYDGTSVRAGFAVLKQWGFVERYTWAWDAQTVARHILEVGPVVVGTTWHWGMFTPDKKGYIWPDGNPAGGHAYLLTAVNCARKNPDGTEGAFRIQNSWGNWGQGGRAWVTISDMDLLIKDYGEACTAQELRQR